MSAAGPGCRISGDLISKMRFAATAESDPSPGRTECDPARPSCRTRRRGSRPGGLPRWRPRNDPVLGRGTRAKMAADVVAAGDLDQLGNPADRGDQRLVPLLKEDARSWASMLLLAR